MGGFEIRHPCGWSESSDRGWFRTERKLVAEISDWFLRDLQIRWLASELFNVRNTVLDEQFPWIPVARSLDDPAHRAVYTALATYIIDFPREV